MRKLESNIKNEVGSLYGRMMSLQSVLRDFKNKDIVYKDNEDSTIILYGICILGGGGVIANNLLCSGVDVDSIYSNAIPDKKLSKEIDDEGFVGVQF